MSTATENTLPKISVVTVVFNRAATVVDAMRSVQEQGYPNLEHVIVDGGSTDGTLEKVRNRADAHTVVISEPDDGIYDAINKGIRRSTGDVVGLVHSDDVLADPDVLSEVGKAFSEDSDLDMVYGDLRYVRKDNLGRTVRTWIAGSFEPGKLRRGWMPPHPTVYMRRRVFDRSGLYDTDFRIAADYDAMLRYLSDGRYKVRYIPKLFVKMRVGGESNRSVALLVRKSREDLKAIRRNEVGGVITLVMKNLRKLPQFVGTS